MLILAGEVHAFEGENEMVRRVTGGPGATTPYDWEGMMVALIHRVHMRGLPAVQAELIAETHDWFADPSDRRKTPDSRNIHRRVTPVWRKLQGEES